MIIKGLILSCILFLMGCKTTTQTSVDVQMNPYDLEDMQIRIMLKGTTHV